MYEWAMKQLSWGHRTKLKREPGQEEGEGGVGERERQVQSRGGGGGGGWGGGLLMLCQQGGKKREKQWKSRLLPHTGVQRALGTMLTSVTAVCVWMTGLMCMRVSDSLYMWVSLCTDTPFNKKKNTHTHAGMPGSEQTRNVAEPGSGKPTFFGWLSCC